MGHSVLPVTTQTPSLSHTHMHTHTPKELQIGPSTPPKAEVMYGRGGPHAEIRRVELGEKSHVQFRKLDLCGILCLLYRFELIEELKAVLVLHVMFPNFSP